jgi:PAS domain S-box-containing protein
MLTHQDQMRSVASNLERPSEQNRFQAICDLSADSIIFTDESLTIRYVNHTTTTLFGYQCSELLGEHISFLLPAIRVAPTADSRIKARHRGGAIIPAKLKCEVLDSGHVIFVRDLRQDAEDHSTQEPSATELQLLLEAIPALIYVRAPNGSVTYVNHRAVEYFGMSSEELCSGGWVDALHPDEKEAVLTQLDQHFAMNQPYSMEYRRRRFDGAYRWFHTNVQPLKNDRGEVVRWYGVLTDIHDRTVAAESLRQMQAKLSEATQRAALTEFAASVIHEISQPLTVIAINSHNALRSLSATPENIKSTRSAVEDIVRDSEDARQIINSLRGLFRKTPPRKVSVCIRQIASQVVTLLQSRFGDAGPKVNLSIPDHLPPLLGDPLQLQQLLMNLITNAFEAMSEIDDGMRMVTVRAREEDANILVEVEDRGCGINDPDRVFETFFTTKEAGMGMGLAICRSIVNSHDGSLWCRPAETRGTVFSFTIPAFS